MSEARRRRPKPERTEPIRNWTRLFGSETPGNASSLPGASGVRDGVELGYKVIRGYLLQGQELAGRRAEEEPARAGPGASFENLTERLLRDGIVWWSQVARMLPGMAAVAGTPGEGPDGVSSAPRPAFLEREWSIELEASGRARVQAQLRGSSSERLGVHPLQAPERESPAIAGVRVESDGHGVRFHVHVPEDQPPGLYSGLVFETGSGEPRGTLTVRVGP